MQYLGGDIGAGEATAQREQLAETLVFGEEGREALREVGRGIALSGDLTQPLATGAAFLGSDLQPDQRSQDRFPERVGHRESDAGRRDQSHHGQRDTGQKHDGVPARVGTIRRAGHAQTERTLRYFS